MTLQAQAGEPAESMKRERDQGKDNAVAREQQLGKGLEGWVSLPRSRAYDARSSSEVSGLAPAGEACFTERKHLDSVCWSLSRSAAGR